MKPEAAAAAGIATEADSYSPTNPIAHLTQDQIAQLTSTFHALDQNSDGFVDGEELVAMLKVTFPGADAALIDEVRQIILDTADRNNDGKIDLSEFLHSIASGQGVLPDEVVEVDPAVANILHQLSAEEIDMLRDTFIRLDRNGDGFVDRVELMSAVQDVVKERFDAVRLYLDKIYEVADKDQDGKLNLTEFLASFAEGPGVVPHEVVMESVATIKVRLTDEEITALQDSFQDIDKNMDGFVDPQELIVALKVLLHKKFPDFSDSTYQEIVKTILDTADKDRDGKLNLAEFIRSFQEDQGVLPHAFIETRAQKVQHRLTKEEIEKLKEAFSVLDTNQDGYIDASELYNAVRGILDNVLENKDEVIDIVALIMGTADKDKDGKLSLTEFIKSFASDDHAMDLPLMAAQEKIARAIQELNDILLDEDVQKIVTVFKHLDKNNDGYLDRRELQDVMDKEIKARYPDWSEDYIDKVIGTVIAAADEDNDGKLSLREFVKSFFEGHGVLPDEYVTQHGADAQQAKTPSKPVEVQPQQVTPQQVVAPPKPEPQPVTQPQPQPVSPPKQTVTASPTRAVPPPTNAVLVSPISTFPNDVSGVAVSDSQLLELFKFYDKDNSGYLNRTEFKEVYLGMENYGLPLSRFKVDALFNKYSKGDERLSFDEFAILMLQRSRM